jgi:hypothetical protein
MRLLGSPSAPIGTPLFTRAYRTRGNRVNAAGQGQTQPAMQGGTRGAGIVVCSMVWTNPQAVGLFRTSCGVSDLSTLFCRPTAAHLAPYYLAIARPAVCAPPIMRWRSPNCDRTKPGSAFRQHIPCRFVAVVMPTLWCTNVRHVSPDRRKRDAGAAAAVPVVCRTGAERRRADRSQSDVVMSGAVDSGRESGHGNIDANDPKRA